MNINANYASTGYSPATRETRESRIAGIIERLQEQQQTGKTAMSEGQLAELRGYRGSVAEDIGQTSALPAGVNLDEIFGKTDREGTQAAETILNNFDYLDGCGPGGVRNGKLTVANLQGALALKSLPSELRSAIEFLLGRPDLMSAINIGDGTDGGDTFSREDFENYVRENGESADDEEPVAIGAGEPPYGFPGKPSNIDPGSFPWPTADPDGEPDGAPAGDNEPDGGEPVNIGPISMPRISWPPVGEPDGGEPGGGEPKPEPTPTPAPKTAPARSAPPAPTSDRPGYADAVAWAEDLHELINSDEEDQVTMKLAARSNDEIANIKTAYSRRYGTSLEAAVTAQFDDEPEYLNYLLAMLRGQRDESGTVNQELVQRDVNLLRGAKDADSDWLAKQLADMFASRSKEHMQAVAQALKEQYGLDIREIVTDQTGGDFEDGLCLTLPQGF